ncbi:hypothetical protein OG936_18555 [Streptomyces sp. NBC_00846]|uniref:hypothetical protein n=1 Tax=Streptomyces sp. NBC_00846 TaxID=2975849 RepID=UPI00386F1503|nr:hypothetical protein OG936_18555 [Streptomyces sp. NBC_00846]
MASHLRQHRPDAVRRMSGDELGAPGVPRPAKCRRQAAYPGRRTAPGPRLVHGDPRILVDPGHAALHVHGHVGTEHQRVGVLPGAAVDTGVGDGRLGHPVRLGGGTAREPHGAPGSGRPTTTATPHTR